ncbi:MAG TPA: biotin/lipoyl-binding protein, partial [Rhizomicrobium sp.]|nr:biotin/lipoyl-binding protein [Rhizomicrobium sp.]
MPNSSPQQKRLRLGGGIALIVAAVVVAGVLASHFMHLDSQRAELEHDTAKGPEVQVVRATASGGMRNITVLADVVPYQVATLYGKVSGYLGKVLVDKGDAVKAGQLLATIESQETDAQYASAAA